jgi:hypothetical protein
MQQTLRGRRVCTACGHENSPDRHSCKQCRQPLTAVETSAQPAPAPAPPIPDERPRPARSGGSSQHPMRRLLRLIVVAFGFLALMGGLASLISAPLYGLFSTITGVALILATLAPRFVASRVPTLKDVPGGAVTALGLVALLAFVGAVATRPIPAPEVRPAATVAVQATPTEPLRNCWTPG